MVGHPSARREEMIEERENDSVAQPEYEPPVVITYQQEEMAKGDCWSQCLCSDANQTYY